MESPRVSVESHGCENARDDSKDGLSGEENERADGRTGVTEKTLRRFQRRMTKEMRNGAREVEREVEESVGRW